MMGQLTSANDKISGLVDDLVEEQTAEVSKASTEEIKKDKLMKIAGVLDGWDVKEGDVDDLETIEFVLDDDMRRTKEAREKARSVGDHITDVFNNTVLKQNKSDVQYATSDLFTFLDCPNQQSPI